MDHLHALVDDSSAPEPVRLAARELVGARLTTELVPLGPGDTRLADVAQTIVAHAKERVHPSTSA